MRSSEYKGVPFLEAQDIDADVTMGLESQGVDIEDSRKQLHIDTIVRAQEKVSRGMEKLVAEPGRLGNFLSHLVERPMGKMAAILALAGMMGASSGRRGDVSRGGSETEIGFEQAGSVEELNKMVTTALEHIEQHRVVTQEVEQDVSRTYQPDFGARSGVEVPQMGDVRGQVLTALQKTDGPVRVAVTGFTSFEGRDSGRFAGDTAHNTHLSELRGQSAANALVTELKQQGLTPEQLQRVDITSTGGGERFVYAPAQGDAREFPSEADARQFLQHELGVSSDRALDDLIEQYNDGRLRDAQQVAVLDGMLGSNRTTVAEVSYETQQSQPSTREVQSVSYTPRDGQWQRPADAVKEPMWKRALRFLSRKKVVSGPAAKASAPDTRPHFDDVVEDPRVNEIDVYAPASIPSSSREKNVPRVPVVPLSPVPRHTRFRGGSPWVRPPRVIPELTPLPLPQVEPVPFPPIVEEKKLDNIVELSGQSNQWIDPMKTRRVKNAPKERDISDLRTGAGQSRGRSVSSRESYPWRGKKPTVGADGVVTDPWDGSGFTRTQHDERLRAKVGGERNNGGEIRRQSLRKGKEQERLDILNGRSQKRKNKKST